MSTPRSLAAAAALLVLAAVAWLALGGVEGREARQAVRPFEAEGDVRTASEPALGSQERARRAAVEIAGKAPEEQAVPGPRSKRASIIRSPAQEAVLEGTLVVQRPDGTSDAGSHAVLQWAVHRGDQTYVVGAQVRGGAWILDLDPIQERLRSAAPPISAFSLSEAFVDGQRALIVAPEGKLSTRASSVEVVVRLPPRVSLRVVDAVTGADVVDVRLAEARTPWLHPGSMPLDVLGPKRSPVDLGALRGDSTTESWFVTAPGYAWTRVEVDFEQGGEHTATLQRGGGLLLSVLAPGSRDGVELRLWSEGDPILSLPLGGLHELRLEGVRAGDYTVRGEVGSRDRAPVILGSTHVQVPTGAFATATLELRPAPQVEVASASGLVLVDPAWPHLLHASLTLDFLGTPLGQNSGRHEISASPLPELMEGCVAFPWNAADLQVGSFQLSLAYPSFTQAVEVPAEGRSDLRMRVPPPATLLVQVRHPHSGAPVQVDSVSWSQLVADVRLRARGGSAEFDPDLERYRLVAPEGGVLVRAWDEDLGRAEERVELGRSAAELVLRLRPPEPRTILGIALLDGEARVPFPPDLLPQILSPAGEPVEAMVAALDMMAAVELPGGGPYLVRQPALPGYEPIPDRIHDAPQGEVSSLVLHLRRAQ